MPIGLNQFINLNDQQLYQMAEYQTAISADNSQFGNNSILYGIPLLDSFTKAATCEGTMGAKAATFAGRMGRWVGFFALASVYNNALDSVKERFPAIKKFDKEHPVMSSVLNVMGLWVGVDYAYKGIKKLGAIFAEKYPKQMEMINVKKQNMFSKLDNNWMSNNIYNPVSKGVKYMEKHYPGATKGLKSIVPWIAPLMVAGAFTKSLCVINDMKNTTQSNFQHLKDLQGHFREQMSA